MPDDRVDDGARAVAGPARRDRVEPDGRHTGRTDLPLTERGEQEARALAPHAAPTSPGARPVQPAAARAAHRRAGRPARRRDRPTTSPSGTTATTRACTTAEIQRDRPGLDDLHARRARRRDGRGGAAARRPGAARAAGALADGPVVLVGHGHFSRVLGARWIGLPVRGGRESSCSTRPRRRARRRARRAGRSSSGTCRTRRTSEEDRTTIDRPTSRARRCRRQTATSSRSACPPTAPTSRPCG